MKKTNQIVLLGISSIGFILAGCSSDINAALSTTEKVDTTKQELISQFTELNKHEKDLQAQFEKTMEEDQDLKTIKDKTSALFDNLDAREEIIQTLQTTQSEFENEQADFEKLEDQKLPEKEMTSVKNDLETTAQKLKQFTDFYTDSLTQQKEYFVSLAEESSTYETFTDGIKAINDKQGELDALTLELDKSLASLETSTQKLKVDLEESTEKK